MRDYLNVLDIAELPPVQRKIMRLVLRRVEMTYSDLCAAVDAMPEGDRLSRTELDEGLEVLKTNRWVVTGEKDHLSTYKVNLRRNSSDEQPSKIERTSIWDSLSLGDDSAVSPSKTDVNDY
jgi:hypothetical protein